MADVRGSQQHKHQQHYGGIGGDQQIHPHQFYGGGDQLSQLHQYTSPDVSKSSIFPQQGPSASQIIAVVTLVPLGGTLLLLAGLTLAGTFLGLALSTPLFLIFSPILVPAIITVGLAVAGILTSGAFGITGLSSFSWLSNFLRQTHLPQQAIRGAQETTDQLSQKARDMGQTISDKAHDVSQNIQGKAQDVGQNVQSKAQETGQKAHDAGHTGRTHEGGRARDVKVT